MSAKLNKLSVDQFPHGVCPYMSGVLIIPGPAAVGSITPVGAGQVSLQPTVINAPCLGRDCALWSEVRDCCCHYVIGEEYDK